MRTQGTSDPSAKPTPAQALLTVRILWAAMIAGQLIFAVVALVLIRTPDAAARPELGRTLSYVGVAAFCVAVPLGLQLRARVYRLGTATEASQPGPVPPTAYVQGNVLHLALCEGAGFIGLVAVLLGGKIWPAAIVPALALAVQVLNFPTGRAMRDPASPRLD